MSIIKVVSPGVNFLADGVLRVTGGSGSNFIGSITVDANGALTGVEITDHGSGFMSNPTYVWISYSGTDVDMDQSISKIRIENGGQGYVDGDFNITSYEGTDFQSSFTVDNAGTITSTFIQSHGANFIFDPTVYDVYYSGTSVKQTNSITAVSIVAAGSGYVLSLIHI